MLLQVDAKAPPAGRSSLERIKREQQDAEPARGLEEVRRQLARIPGSMAAEIVADRFFARYSRR